MEKEKIEKTVALNESYEEKSIKEGFKQYFFISGEECPEGMKIRIKINGDASLLAKIIVAGIKEFSPLDDFVIKELLGL